MPELIDREVLLEAMRDCEAVTHSIGYLDVIAIIEDAPTIESKPVRHGRWFFVGEETMHDGWTYRKYKCSECGFQTVEAKNFCPNCGADMREGGADNG